MNEAGDNYNKCREKFAKVFPEGHPWLEDVDSNRALCYFLQGRFDEAKPLAAKLTEPNCDNMDQELSVSDMLSLGTEIMNGNLTGMDEKVQRIYTKSKRQFGESHPYTQLVGYLMSCDPEEIGRLFLSSPRL